MIIEDSTPVYNLPQIVDFGEAERITESLRAFSLIDVGSSQWLEQHNKLEKLNIQAHNCALSNSEEYVVEALLTFKKVEVLITDLITVEAWKEFAFPLLINDLAGKNNIRLYFILYHEATIINLLECLLFHKHIVAEMNDKLIELIDYIARKMIRLSSGYDFGDCSSKLIVGQQSASSRQDNSSLARDLAASIESRSASEDLMQHFRDIEFRVCISSCTISRFLCEHVNTLPLTAISRITDTHDFLMLVLPLIENPPWTRRTSTGNWEKLIDFTWQEVKPINLLKLTKAEGQPWLTLYHLLSMQQFRERYHLSRFRKEQLLRVRKYLNELLLDQLPVLSDIQR